MLLEELYRTNEEGLRDYLYYLAIGHARLKEYTKALKYVKSFLSIEPGKYCYSRNVLFLVLWTVIFDIFAGNQQVLGLEQNIRKKMEKEGLVGMAVAGGAILAVGAIVGVGMAIAKAK